MENTASEILFAEDLLLGKGFNSQDNLMVIEDSQVNDKVQLPSQANASVSEAKPQYFARSATIKGDKG
jgi:hypothetical protein